MLVDTEFKLLHDENVPSIERLYKINICQQNSHLQLSWHTNMKSYVLSVNLCHIFCQPAIACETIFLDVGGTLWQENHVTAAVVQPLFGYHSLGDS